ncbi:DUF664 domain-containing protein [Aquimarina sp. 2201CG1-2-11]|uniref:DinB family protein n=1 Tax=Aquimarina discodermiae TaxID=3231043 RepID=UPI0034631786
MKNCVSKKISQDWTSFCQSIPLECSHTKRFQLAALVKAELYSPYSRSGLWVRIDNKNGDVGFFDNMKNCPIVSNEWSKYTIEGILDENTSILNFGGLCWHDGVFCFTNFSLSIENEKGILEKTTINNPLCEEVTSQLFIPGWKQGTARKAPKEIKEYKFSSDYSKELNIYYLKIRGSKIFKIEDHYTPQIQILLIMLQDIGKRMIRIVQELTIQEIDYLPNERLNSIGTLIMHIAATETYYQICTFECRKFTEEEKLLWQTAIDMGEKAHKKYVGHSIEHYLEIYDRVREKTLNLFKTKNDDWLKEISLPHNNNHYRWLHVLEHQSFHLGQIVLLKKIM